MIALSPDAAHVRPLVVALVGLAGVGKSSLARMLATLDPEVRARPRISWWRYLASIPAMIPTFVRLHRPFRGLMVKEMKRFLRLHALRRFVRDTKDGRILVFDEGPIYLLARMLVHGGHHTRSPGFEDCWRRAAAMWAGELDAIVWLEAPESVLTTRLKDRQNHPFEYTGDDDVRQLLRAYRHAYLRVLTELTAAGAPPAWTISTDRHSLDRTAKQVLAGLRRLGGAA